MTVIADGDYVAVKEAASLVRVAPSTIRRWIREGTLPACRVGQRRVALKRADLLTMITPVRTRGITRYRISDSGRLAVPRLTPAEQREALAALERSERLQERIMAKLGIDRFSPSEELIEEGRQERTRQLS
ncbi:MAG: helix-turn-helix domain-containing protein [Chloroflexia bacterium]|nr:helix-turn-helix domain-containing protein [Chloroflexia bacterium]